jgi:hypothetical protein
MAAAETAALLDRDQGSEIRDQEKAAGELAAFSLAFTAQKLGAPSMPRFLRHGWESRMPAFHA